MTGIDDDFVQLHLPEFILYWKEDGRAFVSGILNSSISLKISGIITLKLRQKNTHINLTYLTLMRQMKISQKN